MIEGKQCAILQYCFEHSSAVNQISPIKKASINLLIYYLKLKPQNNQLLLITVY